MSIKVRIDAHIFDTACSSDVLNQSQEGRSAGLSFEFVVSDMERLEELKAKLLKQGMHIRNCSTEQIEDNTDRPPQ